MDLIIDTELPTAARWAADELDRILSARGETVRERQEPKSDPCFIIGLAGQSAAVDQALATSPQSCPPQPESLLIQPLSPHQVVVAGSDERGLTYALLEVGRAVELAASDSLFDAVLPAAETPYLSWRGLQLFLTNRTLENEWFYSEEFWDEYLSRLARCRFNNLSLTFGHQIAYLSPPYPFLLDVPEFPQVQPIDFTPEQCRRHLDMLVRVAEMTRRRGLHFTFGVWSQHAADYGDSMVEGLTPDILSDYNAAGLSHVLAACPAIDGVQFRMNYESGVDEDHQAEYYEPQFRAIAACGRPIRLDLRAKGLTDATIELAQSMVADTVVSTKHWCEHLGMPYPMPAVKQYDLERNNYRRYGTWDMLRKPRPYPLVHRLWSGGSQRALLWSDPEWVRRFAATCFPTGEGFEVMAPLSHKGVRDEQPAWSVVSHPDFRSNADEQGRHWLFYLLFGRLGYAPNTDPEVWRRELRHRFGPAADQAEQLYRTGSQILPLLTVVLQYSASLWTFWTERFAGQNLDEDAFTEPTDPTQFYRVDEYVDDVLHNRLCGKWTPPHVAHYLQRLAAQTRALLADFDAPSNDPEQHYTCLDFTLMAHLAQYHAHRLLATTHLALYRKTGENQRLPVIRQLLTQARDEWSALSAAADGKYFDDLVFGHRERRHCGHWKDDLGVVERDLATVDQLIAETPEMPSSQPDPFPGGDTHPDPASVAFDPPNHANAGRDLALHLRFESSKPLRVARCYYRIDHQALDFACLDMGGDGNGHSVEIPGDAIDPEWDLMVFFEFEPVDGPAIHWPDWRIQTPYFVIPVHGQMR